MTDRQMDAIIAEVLFNKNIQWVDEHTPCEGVPYYTDLGERHYGYLNELPEYSTDIKAVSKVVEYFKDVATIDITARGTPWKFYVDITFNRSSGMYIEYKASGETFPKAMCLAVMEMINKASNS